MSVRKTFVQKVAWKTGSKLQMIASNKIWRLTPNTAEVSEAVCEQYQAQKLQPEQSNRSKMSPQSKENAIEDKWYRLTHNESK